MNCWWILGASVVILVTIIVLMLTGVIPVEKKSKPAPAAQSRVVPAAQPQRRSGENLVRAIQASRPPFDQVEADRRSMSARKAAALNTNALARESMKRKL